MLFSIALIDDHAGLLRELADIISSHGDYQVVGTGGEAGSIPKIAAELLPDLMVVDLSMPGDVFAAMTEARTLSPGTRIMVFTAYADVELAIRAFEAGAKAFVIKGLLGQHFFEAISVCLSGGTYVSEPFSVKLKAAYMGRNGRRPE